MTKKFFEVKRGNVVVKVYARNRTKAGRSYRGINVFLLNVMNYGNPYWMSFKQAQALGGTVRKGEKSTPIIFWK